MKHIFLIIIFLQSCTAIHPINKKSEIETKEVISKEVSKDKDESPLKPKPPIRYKTLTKPNSEKVLNYCKKMDDYFKKYSWGESQCEKYSWHHVRSSFLGNPIVWYVFGDESKLTKKTNTTFIECGVHGDEITPIKFCFDLMEDIKNNPKVVGDNLIVIAPLVTPDSFFKIKPTRTNAKGVDVNRNFPTKDWNKSAIKLWKSRYRSDKRRYPGAHAQSEQETIFQVNIIKRYNPNKVISVHSPLTLLDYDGPTFTKNNGKAAKQLLISMSDKAGKYKVSNYPFFTGSLGNWAGNERNIPTYTLELPNSDWHKTDRYFNLFKDAIHHAIQHNLSSTHIDKKVTQQQEKKDKETKEN
jgi:protein MpaA